MWTAGLIYGASPCLFRGSHLPDTQTEIWLLVVINTLRRGCEMWLRKELEKKVTFYLLSYIPLLSVRWWASLLWVVGRYKNTRLWVTMLRASRRFLQRLLLSRASEGLIHFMIQIDGDISLYRLIVFHFNLSQLIYSFPRTRLSSHLFELKDILYELFVYICIFERNGFCEIWNGGSD